CARLLRVDDRALTRDGDGFLHGRDAELRADVRAEIDGDLDVRLDDGLEARELELHGIGADVEARELEAPGLARRSGLRLQQRRPCERHRDAGEHAAGAVSDLAEDLTGL